MAKQQGWDGVCGVVRGKNQELNPAPLVPGVNLGRHCPSGAAVSPSLNAGRQPGPEVTSVLTYSDARTQ